MAFESESYSSQLITDFSERSPAPDITNNNYIEGRGDTVHVYAVGDISVNDTNSDGSVNWQQTSSTEKTLQMNQDIDVSKQIDNVEEFQSEVNIQDAYIEKQRRRVQEDIGDYVMGLYSDAPSDNQIDTTASTASGFVENAVRPAKVALDENNIPEDGRWMVLSPTYADLVQAEAGDTLTENEDVLTQGYVGEYQSFSIYKSNSLKTGESSPAKEFQLFGHTEAITLAVEPRNFVLVENDSQASFHGTGLKARVVYGAKTFVPEALGRIDADQPS